MEEKYERLLAAYAELKQKNAVLKRAVKDHQLQQQQQQQQQDESDTGLKEKLRGRDQQIRDLRQELDAMSFQRDQLSRRVEVLQEEAKTSGSSRSKKGQVAKLNEAMAIQGEELQRKIEENARLHTQLSDLQAKHGTLQRKYKQALGAAREEAKKATRELRRALEEKTEEAEKQQQAAHATQQELDRAREALRSAEEAADTRYKALQEQCKALDAKLRQTRIQLEQQRPAFSTTSKRALLRFNLHHMTRQQENALAHIREQGHSLVEAVVAHATAFLGNLEERAKQLDQHFPVSSDSVQRFLSLLHQRSGALNPVTATFSSWASEGDAQTFLDALSSAAAFIKDVAQQQTEYETVQAESSTCTGALREINAEISSQLNAFADAAMGISAHTTAAAAATAGQSRGGDNGRDEQGAGEGDDAGNAAAVAFEEAVAAVGEAHSAAKALCSAFNSKTALEARLLPLPDATQATDTMLNSALSKLVSALDRTRAFLADQRAPLSGALFACRGQAAAPFSLKKDIDGQFVHQDDLRGRARQFLRGVHVTDDGTHAAESQPSAHSPQEQNRSGDDTESQDNQQQQGEAKMQQQQQQQQYESGIPESLSSMSGDVAALKTQVANLTSRLEKARQEKEQALLDVDLLRVRLKSQQQRGHAAASAGDGADGEEDNPHAANATGGAASNDAPAATGIDDTAEQTATEEGTRTLLAEMAQRERLIKAHYAERVAHLSEQLRYADAKACAFHDECRALVNKLRRLHTTQHQQRQRQEKSQAQGQQQEAAAAARIKQMEEELSVTRKNYEQQLATMTETLVSLKTQLADRQARVEELEIARASRRR